MKTRYLLANLLAATALLVMGCGKNPIEFTDLGRFPADTVTGVMDEDRVTVDHEVTADGGGSLRIDATGPMTVRLYEVTGLNIRDAWILYRVKLRTQDLDREAYLEMWCHFPDQGDYFSRDVEHPLTGTTDWTDVVTPFILKEDQQMDEVRLNLVITGSGTVWIDDLVLQQAPLNL